MFIRTLTQDKLCELFDVSFRFEVITATFSQILVFGTCVVHSDSVDNGCERLWTEQAQTKDHLLSSNQVFVSPTRHFANCFSTVSVHTDPCGVANSGSSVYVRHSARLIQLQGHAVFCLFRHPSELTTLHSAVSVVTRLAILGFNSLQEAKISVFSRMSRLALEPTLQPPVLFLW